MVKDKRHLYEQVGCQGHLSFGVGFLVGGRVAAGGSCLAQQPVLMPLPCICMAFYQS